MLTKQYKRDTSDALTAVLKLESRRKLCVKIHQEFTAEDLSLLQLKYKTENKVLAINVGMFRCKKDILSTIEKRTVL